MQRGKSLTEASSNELPGETYHCHLAVESSSVEVHDRLVPHWKLYPLPGLLIDDLSDFAFNLTSYHAYSKGEEGYRQRRGRRKMVR